MEQQKDHDRLISGHEKRENTLSDNVLKRLKAKLWWGWHTSPKQELKTPLL